MTRTGKFEMTPILLCTLLVASLSLTACSDDDSDDNVTDMTDVEDTSDPDDTTNDTDDVEDTDTSGTASSTAGVLCDYMDVTFNASESVNAESVSTWTCSDTTRELLGNGLPDHDVGTLPNDNNPTGISEQDVSVSYTLDPVETGEQTELGGGMGAVGHVLNSVKMDPGTAGTCNDAGDDCSLIGGTGTWSIEALGQDSFDFGEDFNNAHVQPTGEYHYHGMPEGFIEKQGGNETNMTLIGWAADGFPIYARYGYSDPQDASSELKVIEGSYELISTVPESRPSTDLYALGTFSSDFEYVQDSGDLDACNGRTGVTPEFPGGIYHYFATDSYPYIQRCVTGAVEVEAPAGPPRQ